ncbi:MAG: DUF72 domain-containing protein [Bryobacteraceae bacterium]
MSSPALHCGPAGWSYPHWNAVVYPKPRPRGFHGLEYLSQYFDGVELNVTFYQPLKPEIARLWLRLVEGNRKFQFTAKLGRRFTHERELDAAEIGRFKDGLWPLLKAGRLGCLLMQFPWSFRYTEENRKFFVRLRRAFHEFPLAAEMRHSSWGLDEAVGTFVDYRVGYCNIDQPAFTKALGPSAHLTSPIGYFRLHGRALDERIPQAARNDYLYSPAELDDWKRRIERVAAHADRTFVFLTNDAGGKAVVNALQLQAMLGVGAGAAPRTLARQYRYELSGLHVSRPAQRSLLFDPSGDRAVA